MGRENESTPVLARSSQLSWPLRYGGALLAVGAGIGFWLVSSVIHRDPFAVFILAVIFTARFLGFGPAVFGTALSVVAIDYLSFEPRLSLAMSGADASRLVIFVVISLLAASLARQKSRAEILAHQTLEEMAAIVESSEDAIYSATREGIITSWNHGAEQLYGYPAEDVLGQSVLVIVPPERAHETRSNLAKLARGISVESYQTERRRKDGSLVSLLLSISPLRNRKGLVVGASAIARDISKQLRAEEALRRSEKLATAGRLTAAIAHEINNPLEAVTNLLYLARRDPARADQHLEMAEREVLRVADIAQQALGFVRDVSDARPLNVSSTLEEVLQLYSVKITSKKIATKKELDPHCEISGFAGELRQLFSNLIVNAVDALPPGGRLRLRVSRAQERSGDQRSGVRVIFADNGKGIPATDRVRIFEPFFTTKKDSGTGLGLWLAEGIVRRHGGQITVRTSTSPGRSGTVFCVFLPQNAAVAA